MANPLFNAMNNQPPNQGGPFDIIRQYNSFRQDPFTFMLKAKGIQIPKEYLNDPEGAVRYLMSSGNLTQSDLQTVKDVANRMGINIPI